MLKWTKYKHRRKDKSRWGSGYPRGTGFKAYRKRFNREHRSKEREGCHRIMSGDEEYNFPGNHRHIALWYYW